MSLQGKLRGTLGAFAGLEIGLLGGITIYGPLEDDVSLLLKVPLIGLGCLVEGISLSVLYRSAICFFTEEQYS